MEKDKKIKEKEKSEKEDKKNSSVEWFRFFGSTREIRRSVAALFTFAFFIFFTFSFFSSAGILGEYANSFSGMIFGWGKWIFPILLLAVTWFLLQGGAHLYYVSIFSLVICFLALLGIFHLFVEPSEISQAVFEGRAGGYIGYIIVSAMIPLLGFFVSSIFLFIFFFSGMLIAFGVSLFPFIPKLKSKKGEGEGDVNEGLDGGIEKLNDLENSENTIHGDEFSDNFEYKEKDSLIEISHPQVTNVQFEKDHFITDIEFQNKNNREQKNIEEDKEYESGKIGKFFFEEEIEKKKKSKKKKFIKWTLPPLSLLSKSSETADSGDAKKKKKIVVETLAHFGIAVVPVEERVGPTVTQYRFRPAAGVKLEKILGLTNNLTLALKAHSIRLEAPIPGEDLIGIEVPNERIAKVSLFEVLKSPQFQELIEKKKLPVALGKDVSGKVVFGTLTSMPHLLIAGTTGSGKSVCINSLILSLLFAYGPKELRLILVDPKQVELSQYSNLPLLKGCVIIDMKKAVGALSWAIIEMEDRYSLLTKQGVRDILSYNEKIRTHQYEEGEEELKPLPFIVIVLEEFSDLMMTNKKDVEAVVARLAQKSRAVGIHLILCMQRPSVETVTGLIKTNISTRISFKVASQIDSRTILDQAGAEKLLGNGDMLFKISEDPKPRRIQGVYVSTEEVQAVVEFIIQNNKKYQENEISESIEEFENQNENENTKLIEKKVGTQNEDDMDFERYGKERERDSLFEEAKNLVISGGEASASLLQRQLSVGYNRAAKLLDALEEEGIIGPKNGAKGRVVLVDSKISEVVLDEENKRDIVD
ncbi:MAG: DNA translocase FtsK 4TM domain-containing protein [Candidatus Moraniibacteriota bacterium]|nr:MAG: DNA translocase FtsK 4TM domain-containing protein [Candidatus Moranbacteria bacterium]